MQLMQWAFRLMLDVLAFLIFITEALPNFIMEFGAESLILKMKYHLLFFKSCF